MRHFFLLAIALTMAWFATLSPLFTSVAYAADEATRTNDVVNYGGRTYTHASSLPGGLPQGTSGFSSLDESSGRAYFILVTSDYKTAKTGQYVEYAYTPPNTFTSPRNSKSITIKTSAENGTTTLGKGSTTTCDSSLTGAVGWIICPVTTFLSSMMDKIYNILTDFLEVKTITSNQQSSIYKIWAMVRDMANVCFAIAVLIIIFSQVSNLGISNYGIKKLLPRIIVGAILVNISYWLSALAVDISNLLGYSIHATFMDVVDKINVNANYNRQAPNWESITAVVLAGGAGAGAIGLAAVDLSVSGAAISVLIPVLVGVILAAIIAFLIMAARQALILCFVMISPLAFVAYLLPNTEKYFQKWLRSFTTLLVLFPLFSIIFSGAQLAGIAIIQNSADNLINVILGMAVQVAPIVVTPLLVKFSGGVIGKFAGIVNNPKKGLLDRSRNWSKSLAQDRKNRVLHGKPMYDKNGNFIGFRKGKNGKEAGQRFHPTRAYDTHRRKVEGRRKAYEQAGTNRFNQTTAGKRLGGFERYGSTHGSVLGKQMDNRFLNTAPGRNFEVHSRNLGAENTEAMNRISASHGGQAAEARTRNAATRKKEIGTHFNRTHHEVLRREQMADVDNSVAENEFNASTMGQQVDHARRVASSTKQRIENEHETKWNDAIRTNSSIKTLVLEEKSSEGKLNAEKKRTEKMFHEITAQGDQSEHVINLRGVSPTAQDHVLQIARDLKDTTIEASFTDMASTQAKNDLENQITQALKTNSITIDGKTTRLYSAGIGNESAVFASAIAKSRKEFAEEQAQFTELAHHFKLDANQIGSLSMLAEDSITATDDSNNTFTFEANNDYVHEMAIDEIFKVGSHNQKMAVIKSTGKRIIDENGVEHEGVNYGTRRSVQQAAISSGFKNAAPAINDKTLNDIINGDFNGDQSWQYHSLREIYEGRLTSGLLSTANVNSLKKFFADIENDVSAREQYNNLIRDKAIEIQNNDPSISAAAAQEEARQTFEQEREKVRGLATKVVRTSTINQTTTNEAMAELKRFTGIED